MRLSKSLVALGVGAMVSTAMGMPVQAAPDTKAAAVTPLPNPTVANACGLDATLVLDASGSIQTSNAVDQVRNAGKAFVRALKDTKSTARVTQFATFSEQLAPRTLVDAAATAPGGALTAAMNKYYNPKPPRPSDSTIYKYKGSGAWNSAANYTVDNTANQYTNWDAAMTQAGTEATAPEIVVFVTDGDPTAFNLNQSGDPNYGNGKNVAMNTDRGDALQQTIDRAVMQANNTKGRNARVMVVGVGPSVTTPGSASVDRMKKMSGPQVVQDSQLSSITNINQIDVALVKDFDKLASFLRQVVSELCTPSMTIRKWAQGADNGDYQPAAGWNMEVTPTVPGGFDWILPDTAPAASKNEDTDAQGYAQFQWEPKSSGATSNGHVAETVKSNFTGGRPGKDNDWTCELRTPDDDAVQTVKGDFLNPDDPEFDVTVGPRNIVTCDVYNSFNYDPKINVVKSAKDTVTVDGKPTIRGNGDGWNYSYQFDVTNPGNTPLSGVKVVDSKCDTTPDYVSGDTNADSRLDPGETWVFQCSKFVLAATTDKALKVDNTATASGVDPSGTTVNDQDSAAVYVRTPAMKLTKTADPVKVPSGAPVTYTYELRNTGNDPISTVEVKDDKCSPLSGPTGDSAPTGVLGVGETWTYTCTTDIYEPTINTADASGNWSGYTPAGQNNKPVTAKDTAEVDVSIPAYLTIVKRGVPTGDQDFSFTASGVGLSPGDASFTLNPDADPSRTLVVNPTDAGTPYSVTEASPPNGWDLTALECEGAPHSISEPSATVTLKPGDEATCVYTNTQRGSLTVRKETEPAGADQAFEFTASPSALSPDLFSLKDGQEQEFTDLKAGQKAKVAEAVAAGWELADISCNDEATYNPTSVELTIQPGLDTVCVFTNRQIPKASLTVVKQADPVDGSFDYGVTGTGVPVNNTFTLAPNGNDPMPSQTLELSPPLGAATNYEVTETAPKKWAILSILCEVTDSTGATTEYKGTLNDGKVTVPLSPGDAAVCTYVNQRLSTLTIIKNVSVAPNDPDAKATVFDFMYSVNGSPTTDFSLQDFDDYGTTKVIDGLKAGVWVRVTEFIPANWTLSGVFCVGNSNAPLITGEWTQITMAAGEDVTCAFADAKAPPGKALLEIAKLADPADNTDFGFTVTGTGAQDVTVKAPDNPSVTQEVDPGGQGSQYTITENPKPGWDQTTFTCSVNGGTPVDPVNGTVTLTLNPNDTALCIAVNTKQGSLTIIKQTNPSAAEQAFGFSVPELTPSSFTLKDGEKQVYTAIPANTDVNITEDAVDNWVLQDFICDARAYEGNTQDQHVFLTIGAGEDVVCTFVNAELPPAYIATVKVADPEDGTQFDFSLTDNVPSTPINFTLDPPNSLSDVRAVRPDPSTGTVYNVTETPEPGYDTTKECVFWDVDGNSQMCDPNGQTLKPGYFMVETFTNVKQGTFTVTKSAPADPERLFPFEAVFNSPQGPPISFDLKDGESKDWTGIAGNTLIQVVESPRLHWTLEEIVCNVPTVNVDLPSGYVALTLGAGEDANCTFVNVPTIYNPQMTLEKIASQTQVLPGGQVVYTYTLTNVGDIDLHTPPGKTMGNAVSDDKCSPLTITGGGGAATALPVGASAVYTCTTTLSDTTENTATATMLDLTSTPPTELEVTDNEIVEILTPAINIVKTASSNTIYKGDQVTYQYSVTNPGQVPLANVEVTDALCTPVGPQAGWDLNNNGLLDPLTEEQVWECTTTLNVTTTNTGEATGTPTLDKQPPGTPVRDSDTETVTVLDPGLTLTKTPSATGGVWEGDVLLVASGTEVTYTYEVDNTGDTPLDLGSGVADNRCAPVAYVGGDLNSDGLLDPTETWIYECKTTPVGDTGVITNTADVTGTDPELGRQVTDDAAAKVESLLSGIAITKRADKIAVEPGTRVTYTYVVSNTGRTVLHDIAVADDRCSPLAFKGGDVNSDGKLDLDERWTYTCSAVLERDTENLATATGKDPGDNVVKDQAPATVLVFGDSVKPAIAVRKTPSATEVAKGTAVTYTYEVVNAGSVPLANVRLTDDKCSPVTYVSGDTDNDGLLVNAASGEGYGDEVWKFTCTTTISVETTNTVIAKGAPWQNGEIVGNEVTAQAQATVRITQTPVPPDPPDPSKPRLPIITDTVNRKTFEPGSFVTLVDSSRTKKQGVLKYRTRCRSVKASASGEASYCKVRVTKAGRVKVKVMGYRKVRVTVYIRAVPKPKYRDQWRVNTWKRTWVLKPKR